MFTQFKRNREKTTHDPVATNYPAPGQQSLFDNEHYSVRNRKGGRKADGVLGTSTDEAPLSWEHGDYAFTFYGKHFHTMRLHAGMGILSNTNNCRVGIPHFLLLLFFPAGFTLPLLRRYFYLFDCVHFYVKPVPGLRGQSLNGHIIFFFKILILVPCPAAD